MTRMSARGLSSRTSVPSLVAVCASISQAVSDRWGCSARPRGVRGDWRHGSPQSPLPTNNDNARLTPTGLARLQPVAVRAGAWNTRRGHIIEMRTLEGYLVVFKDPVVHAWRSRPRLVRIRDFNEAD
jgi:hypothetical protein